MVDILAGQNIPSLCHPLVHYRGHIYTYMRAHTDIELLPSLGHRSLNKMAQDQTPVDICAELLCIGLYN